MLICNVYMMYKVCVYSAYKMYKDEAYRSNHSSKDG